MNDLENILKKALPYQSSETNILLIDLQRNRFLNYCKENDLDKTFSDLLNNNPYWRLLAEVEQTYFVEEFEYRTKKNNLPCIKLCFFNSYSSPIIKLLLPKNSDHFSSR